MFKLLRFLFLSAALLGVGGVYAQTDNATAEALARKSGLWEQLSSVAPQVLAGFSEALSQVGTKPSAVEIDRISRVIQDAYSVTGLRAVSVGVIAGKLSARDIADLLRWYDSPVGQRITKLEEEASAEKGDPQALLQQGLALVEKLPPARRRLLDELLTETRTAEAMTQITINTLMAVQQGAASALSNTPAAPAPKLKAALESQRPQMLKEFAALSLAGFAKVYETMPTEFLEQYVAFVKSAAGRDFNTLCLEALDAAFTEAAAEFGRGLPGAKDQSNK